MLIAITGCYQGMQVKGNAEEVGLRTTAAVVQGIFMVIVLDAFFAVFFTEIGRSEEHTSELQSLMRISYAVFCLKKKTRNPLQLGQTVAQVLCTQSSIDHVIICLKRATTYKT